MNFSMPEGGYFYDSYLWLDNTTIIRAEIIGRGLGTQIYNGIVNRRMTDPSLLVKDYSGYNFNVFPISTTFRRKVKLSYSVPFISNQVSKEYLELPTDIILLVKPGSTITITCNKKDYLNFSNSLFPLNSSTLQDNTVFKSISCATDDFKNTNKNYLEFENLNPKIVSFYYQQISADEGFYDLRIRSPQLSDIPKPTSIFDLKIPMEDQGIVFHKLNNSSDKLNPMNQYNETGKYYGHIKFADSLVLNYKSSTGIISLKEPIYPKDSGSFIYKNWTNLYCNVFNNIESMNYSLKNRVISSQTAFLALETGDTVKSAVGDDTYNGGFTTDAIRTAQTVQLDVFPNPFLDHISLNSKADILSVQIYDAKGQKLFAKSFSKSVNETEINFADLNLPSGIYFLLVETADGMQSIKLTKEL
jgi:hypothetical protein